MNIVFFTNKSEHGVYLLESLKKQNIPIAAIVIDENTAKLSTGGMVKHKIRNAIPVGLLAGIRKLRGLPLPPAHFSTDFYRTYSSKVLTVSNFNSKESEAQLKALKPDLLVLGGARILREHILTVPTQGVVNAHPGLLPAYRGVDVIRWALLNGDPVGVTVHFVNAGVDTGKIIKTQEITVEEGDKVSTLKGKAVQLAGELMAQAVQAISKGEALDLRENPAEEGKQYYKMEMDKAKQVDEILGDYD